MNEDTWKVRLNKKGESKRHGKYVSYWVKPSGKFWKRFFNKKVRKGQPHKTGNWFYWS